MKKYICPETDFRILNIQEHLLAGSPTGSQVYDDDADKNAEVLSRHHYDVWEDDEKLEDEEF